MLSLLFLRSAVAELKCYCCIVDNDPSVLSLAWPVTEKSTLFFHLRNCKHTWKEYSFFLHVFTKLNLMHHFIINEKDAKSFPVQEPASKEKKKAYIIAFHDTGSSLAFCICRYQNFATSPLWLCTEGKICHNKVNRFAQGHEADRAWDWNADFLTASSCLQKQHKRNSDRTKYTLCVLCFSHSS